MRSRFKILNVSTEWLETGVEAVSDNKTPYTTEKPSVPVFTLKELNRDLRASTQVTCPFPHGPTTFALLIGGDPGTSHAMQPPTGRAYPVGSIVFADPSLADQCESGDIVIAEVTGHQANLLHSDNCGEKQVQKHSCH